MAKKKETEGPDFSFFTGLKTGNAQADSNFRPEPNTFFDSGCYVLNGVESGDLLGGFPTNRWIMFDGEEGCGKSLVARNNWARPLMAMGYFIFYFCTEQETDESDLEEQWGFPAGQYKLCHVTFVEDLITQMNNVLNGLEADKGKSFVNKRKVAFLVDSIGNLSNYGFKKQADRGDVKGDMGIIQKLLRGFFKLNTARAGRLGVPGFFTNHIYYDPNQMFGDKRKTGGGMGGKYNCSNINRLGKWLVKNKDTKEVLGVKLTVGVEKSRFVRLGWTCEIYIDYKKGLNRWYGLNGFARMGGLLDDYTETAYPDTPHPLDPATGKKDKHDLVVIKDPKKDPKDWIVCPEAHVHRKAVIGTILNEINEWFKSYYHLIRLPGPGEENEYDSEVDLKELESSSADKSAEDPDSEDSSNS